MINLQTVTLRSSLQRLCSITIVLLFVVPITQAANKAGDLIPWQDWSSNLFERAQKEQRFVILDLEAVWCHWCHVMDRDTYMDPEVAGLINEHYIPVRVDQDANPDLANRYGDYGWPATIVFSPDGHEIVKRRGYIPAINMASMLQAIIDDPSPGPSVLDKPKIKPSSETSLQDAQRDHLETVYFDVYDAEHGGWGNIHKYLHADAMEFALMRAQQGDRMYSIMARQTLTANLNLLDPVWGGVYQYSDSLDWRSPHYEKIMSTQTANLRMYSLAYALWKNPQYSAAAESIYSYLLKFMRHKAGAFYTSQDADLNTEIDGNEYYALGDEARQKLGYPKIDRNIYSRENGWVIRALTGLYDATGNQNALIAAKKAARYILKHRRINGGGFRHGKQDPAGPYLTDNQSMAQALLSLYRSTGEAKWLDETITTLDFIARTFRDETGGFRTSATAESDAGVFTRPVKLIDENTELTRLYNLAFHYTGNTVYRDLAEHGMRYLTSPVLVESEAFYPGILLADHEINQAPVHITVVGSLNDKAAQSLYASALAYPVAYKRQEWWDRQRGELLNQDIEYPDVELAAAFACAEKTCSLPVYDPAGIAEAVDRISSPE